MYEIGQLVWLIKSDKSGLMDHPPVLILKRYFAIPQAFPQDPATNKIFAGKKQKLVYDIMCDGIVEKAVDADWLSDFMNIDTGFKLGEE